MDSIPKPVMRLIEAVCEAHVFFDGCDHCPVPNSDCGGHNPYCKDMLKKWYLQQMEAEDAPAQ